MFTPVQLLFFCFCCPSVLSWLLLWHHKSSQAIYYKLGSILTENILSVF